MIKRTSKKQRRTRVLTMVSGGLAVLGYVSCTLQWLWLCVTALPSLLKSGVLDDFIKSEPTEQTVLISPLFTTSPITVAFIGFVTLVMLAITIYILFKLPTAIAKTGEVIVHTATESVVPVITHHQKLPAKKKSRLTRKVSFYIQLFATIVPLVSILFLPPIKSLPQEVIVFIAGWLAVFSVIFFSGSFFLRPSRHA